MSKILAKLKAYSINPLLSSSEIEAAINDFRIAFGETNAIFEEKMAQFELLYAAAVIQLK